MTRLSGWRHPTDGSFKEAVYIVGGLLTGIWISFHSQKISKVKTRNALNSYVTCFLFKIWRIRIWLITEVKFYIQSGAVTSSTLRASWSLKVNFGQKQSHYRVYRSVPVSRNQFRISKLLGTLTFFQISLRALALAFPGTFGIIRILLDFTKICGS